MADNCITNSYEEIRKQRLEENRKRFEDLGIAKISKSLQQLSNPEKKSPQRLSKPKQKTVYAMESRRSSRARNPVPSYREDLDVELPCSRRSRSSTSSWASYIARPLDECRTASFEERAQALKVADDFKSSLQSGNPSFTKSMVRSHVYSCFWLGLPTKFCVDFLPKSTVDMVLEDEDGKEFDAIYIGRRTGLSGGWRAFALEHKLDDGDGLVFELIESNRFKIYIFRVSLLSSQLHTTIVPLSSTDQEPATHARKRKMPAIKPDLESDQTEKAEQPTILKKNQKCKRRNVEVTEGELLIDDLKEKKEFVPENGSESTKKGLGLGKNATVAFKPRRKPAPRYLQKRS